MCHNGRVLNANRRLRSAAMLALTKLMIVDASFCDFKPFRGPAYDLSNLDLLFSLLNMK